MMYVQLPDRTEITLCEAVTAFVYGESRNASSGPFYASKAADAVLEQLESAARAGHVKLRALKWGGNKYEEIGPFYFSTRRYFAWGKDEIHSWGPIDEREYRPVYDGQQVDQVLGVEWYDVHLDRQAFASLLRAMGVSVRQGTVSVQQRSDPDVPGGQVIHETGDPGRGSSKHLYMAEARRRLDTGDVPDGITEFSKQLANWLKCTHPLAAQPTPRTIENRIRPLWRSHR